MKYFLFLALSLFNCGTSQKGEVFFLEPSDGAELSSPVTAKFGVKNLAVEPAGEIKPGSGHHHLLINHESTPSGDTIPADQTHIHYGKAQAEAQLNLEPGNYKLTMQFANGAHQSYGPELSQTISITVK
jgi:hypothetical protein